MLKRYDKPIPFGWYAVEYSGNLAVGEVKPLKYFGRELVLFRTESGQASLLDAYCPHLGAHLGHGGIVKGESISCPFHGWQFDGEGMCTDIPYAKRMPPKIDGKQAVGKYHVEETNQMIWAWYHPQNVAPLFPMETISELHSDEWSAIDTYEWTINTIPQETGENAADIAHFVTVHSSVGMPDAVVTMDGPKRLTMMNSETQEIDAHGNVDRSGENTAKAKLESWNLGPGFTYQKFSRLFDIVMVGTVTPIDDQNIHMRFNFTLPKEQSGEHQMYANGFRDEIVFQVGQDIPIWEHKTYVDNPVLCDGDGPIAKYRKWFQQFYASDTESANRAA
ncbi:Rieske 2Fe-2S domain-containing protein [Oceanicoccus sp. KOV_DT_Chl]|uniref:Rieske 2Fe-2S domain-containing protein n=1 Tax=Oceanicoccus sp. KOV_DT_Chl TaxID=1904639 RepID=UPI000C7DCDDF|nr:Rieske 2Fe-2S domain-containing protein [Oceanicoccus sp. KOV_DT_Chl]